jgi:hypothetical protein
MEAAQPGRTHYHGPTAHSHYTNFQYFTMLPKLKALPVIRG